MSKTRKIGGMNQLLREKRERLRRQAAQEKLADWPKREKQGTNVNCDLIGHATEFHFTMNRSLSKGDKVKIIEALGIPLIGLCYGVLVVPHEQSEIRVPCIHFRGSRVIVVTAHDPRSAEAEQVRDRLMEALEGIWK